MTLFSDNFGNSHEPPQFAFELKSLFQRLILQVPVVTEMNVIPLRDHIDRRSTAEQGDAAQNDDKVKKRWWIQFYE